MIRLRSIFLFIILFQFIFPACNDHVRDEFPRRRFIGFFDVRDPRYSKNVFTATRDIDANYVGINGIVVYKSGDQYYAFDLMCPHEKSHTCSIKVDEEEPNIAECQCCGSKFLIASETGDRIEGPTKRGLHPYNAKMEDNMLVVSSY